MSNELVDRYVDGAYKGWILGNIIGAPIASIVMIYMHHHYMAALFAACAIVGFVALSDLRKEK